MIEYRDIPDFPGYRAGNDGSILSSMQGKWKVMKQRIKSCGSRQVGLVRQGEKSYQRVARLVLLAFVGPPPAAMECCHRDGNPANNSLENLRWDTRKGNMADSIRHGTFIRGTKHPASKLSDADVLAIREMSHSGASTGSLARRFSVNSKTIYRILHRERWKHVF